MEWGGRWRGSLAPLRWGGYVPAMQDIYKSRQKLKEYVKDLLMQQKKQTPVGTLPFVKNYSADPRDLPSELQPRGELEVFSDTVLQTYGRLQQGAPTRKDHNSLRGSVGSSPSTAVVPYSSGNSPPASSTDLRELVGDTVRCAIGEAMKVMAPMLGGPQPRQPEEPRLPGMKVFATVQQRQAELAEMAAAHDARVQRQSQQVRTLPPWGSGGSSRQGATLAIHANLGNLATFAENRGIVVVFLRRSTNHVQIK